MSLKAYDSKGNHIGEFDGEYFYDKQGVVKLRVDGDEIYSNDIPCKYIGVFEGNEAKELDGSVIFRLER